MFFGLPCIGTDAWAVPEMIRDGETGFTIPIDDLDAIGDRLLRLLSDPGLARRMGQAGRERAEKYFTWPAVVRRMLGTLTTVVERAQKIA
jgi:glycosyltransferase involved in cell wall biosynthesis